MLTYHYTVIQWGGAISGDTGTSSLILADTHATFHPIILLQLQEEAYILYFLEISPQRDFISRPSLVQQQFEDG